MSNKVVAVMHSSDDVRSALDQFLSEAELERRARRADPVITVDRGNVFLDPREVKLDALEAGARTTRSMSHSPEFTNVTKAQLWPMLAAAFVALGVTMIILSTLARSGLLGPQL